MNTVAVAASVSIFLVICFLETLILISFLKPDLLLPKHVAKNVPIACKNLLSTEDYFAFSICHFFGFRIGSMVLPSVKQILFQNRISLTAFNGAIGCFGLQLFDFFGKQAFLILGCFLMVGSVSVMVFKGLFFEYSYHFNPTEGVDFRDFTVVVAAAVTKETPHPEDEEAGETSSYLPETYEEDSANEQV